ncbi:2-keto-4-pentenoate hydratase [Ancylobacter defluvii]|uniref:Hydratase n=1 Tax=Ancylobacter defluvii TaxID=1282440 RepID=A0A9W6JVX4_9HYPH|nr:2-keto-4-pentenoate hydratase [Ancylobacter defluvii]MBS7590208.1 2-keto-4-pentenoate hydratase [Ancylobacter defluvii]GLK82849.1 hydratase [Ancylobacter defluvii]
MTPFADASNKVAEAARRIAKLRASGERVATASFGWEPTLQEANDAQHLHRGPCNAWKVAKSPEGNTVVSRLIPLVGEGMPLVWRPGTMLEIEIAVTLDRDLPIRTGPPYTRADVLAAVGRCRLGAELVRSVFQENGKVSFSLFVADGMGNDGYLLGPSFPKEELDALQTSPLAIEMDGKVVFDAVARHSNGDCLGWLVEFANSDDRSPGALVVGTLVTTGSLCGTIALPSPGRVTARLSAALRLELVVRSSDDTGGR